MGESSHSLLATVVVATHQGAPHIGRALDSLGAQSVAPESFEILLVLNCPPCATPSIVEAFRRTHPRHVVRMIVVDEASTSNARNIGLASARGQHITFMDDDDFVSPGYMEALLDAAEPGVVPVAFIVDVAEGSHDVPTGPVPANYFNTQILEHAGRILPAEEASSVLSANVAKLVPAAVARDHRYRTDLRSGEDFVFWTELYAYTNFCFRITDLEARAIYYRTVRPGSVSRQAPSYDFNVTQRLNCIAALGFLLQDDATVNGVVRGKIAAQVHHISAFVTAFPDRRSEVLDDIRSRSLPWFPYDVLNRGAARDLALLYCFAPYQDTSALVAARRIRERGVVVDVISNRLDKLRQQDDWSSSICEEYTDEVRVLGTPQGMGSWRSIREFVDAAMAEVSALESEKGPYRSVYSRSMWPASHFAAARYKLDHPEARWIAEFSDPMLHDIKGAVRADQMQDDELTRSLREALATRGYQAPNGLRMWQWLECIAYALADEVVFTNANQREYMLSYAHDQGLARRALEVSRVSHHPTLPEHFYRQAGSSYELDPRVVNVAYFGVFYATRGLTEVVDALRSMSVPERTNLRLHVFTDKPDDTRAGLADVGLTDVVVVNGYVPFLEFLHLTTRFDVLLVNDAATREHHPLNPYLPSKLSDYLGSGTPIWSIVEEGSVLSRVETRHRSFLGDVTGARSVLRELAGVKDDDWLVELHEVASVASRG